MEIKDEVRNKFVTKKTSRQHYPVFSGSIPSVERRGVAPTLKLLNVGETAVFPIEQRSTIHATVFRLRKDYLRYGWNVSIKDNDREFTTEVTRIS